MDINEARKTLQATEDEIKSAQHYFGFEHTSINMLSDLDPRAFCELNRQGWLLAENRDDLQRKLKIFVDMYSLMYKDSIGTNGTRGLVRGTSIERARSLVGSNKQFLSTSRDESISKRFCEYGSPALVRISIGEGVPHLYSENYRESGVNEEEVIIAPFCKIKDNRLTSRWDGYEYYSVSIEKGELQEKSQEEIDSLTKQALDGYEQNITDMKEYTRLSDRIEFLREKLGRTTDREERMYISQELKQTETDFDAVWTRTTEYKRNLAGLLQGMCRGKEKEIDEAREIVEKDREQKRKELEEKKKEDERKGAITDLAQRITDSVQKTGKINESILEVYTQLVSKQEFCRGFARDFGVGLAGSVETQIGKDVTDVTELVRAVGEKLKQIQINENNTIEETKEQEEQYANRLGKIDASMEIADTLREVTEIYSVQAEDSIKRDIYLRMHSLMKNTRMSLLQQQSISIQNQKRGLFDALTGKAELRQLQLRNIDLKMQLISRTNPEPKSYYSVHDMLAEMYTFSQTELGGKYTPELGKLFTTIQEKFHEKDGKEISLEEIQRLAKPKIEDYQKQNLPAVPSRKIRLFGKTKDEIEHLQVQNSQVQTKINNVNTYSLRSQIRPPEKPATEIFKQRLMDIVHNIDADDGPTKTPDRTIDDTVDLWK